MPIAGVGRVEPMDPVVKREVMRRARESGTFATEPDAAWVGSPLPASVNRRVGSRDATKRSAGPDAPMTSSSHFGATVAPRMLDYDGPYGRGSFSGAAVHPTPSDGDAPSPDRVEAFRGMSPTPESPAGFGAGRLPWGSIDLTERVPTPTTEYVDTDDDDDDVTPRSPGGGPLTLRRARELQADKERAHAAAAAALGAGPPLPSSSRGDDTARTSSVYAIPQGPIVLAGPVDVLPSTGAPFVRKGQLLCQTTTGLFGAATKSSPAGSFTASAERPSSGGDDS